MIQHQTYQKLLQTSERITWQVEDLMDPHLRLEFTKPFLPESLARVRSLSFLTAEEQQVQDQSGGHGYPKFVAILRGLNAVASSQVTRLSAAFC